MKFKKLFFVLSAIIAGMHATSAWATDVAKIGEAGYETFAAALSAVQDGDVIYLLADADASSVAFTPCNGKSVIIAGQTGDEVLNMGDGHKGGIQNANITFLNLKMQIRHTLTSSTWYTEGMYHATKIKYENVVFDGVISTYNDVDFLNCTFTSNPQNIEYTTWNYGGTQIFKGCKFEAASAGTKSFVKLYNQGAPANVVVIDCEFTLPEALPESWKGNVVYSSNPAAVAANAKEYTSGNKVNGTLQEKVVNYSGGSEDVTICSSIEETGFTLPTPTTFTAKIGDVEYTSLAAAVAAVPTDGTETTITMIDDANILGNAGITIAAGQNIVLDLNGKTVKNLVNEDKSSQVIANKGTLTIKDSSTEGTGILTNAVAEGTNAGEWWGTEQQYNYATNVITNTGTLIVVSGEIYETAAGSICYAIDNNSSAADAILTVNGGYIHKDSGTAIRQFCNSTTKENTVNVNGGTIEGGKAGIWIQLPGSSTEAKKVALNVTGGTLKGTYAFYDYTYGDIFDASQYNITGGTFNGDVFSYGANVAISGGEFNGEVAIQQVNSSNVSVTGGTFAGDIYTYGANASTGFITGGTFKISEYEEADGKTCACEWISCLAEGLAMAKNADGTFGVEEAKIAKIGDTTYPSLAAAVAAAPADGTETTITMIDDANILGNAGVTIAAGQNIVLDLNGKTVKNLVNENKASQLITNKGTLKITGDGIMTNELADGTIAGDWPTYNYATNLITNVGTLTIENGTFNNTQDSGITYTLDNNSNGVPATATINGGKFVSAGNAAVRMFCNSTTAANTLTINGGYFEGNYYAVSVSNASGATKVGSLTINDGEFESRADEYNACVANWESNKSSNIAVSITGGKFNDYVLIASNANVTGGTYKYGTYTDPDDGTVYDLNEYLAAGFELNENADGTFGVQVGKMMVYTLDAKEGTEMSSSEFITLAESNPNAIAIVGSELEEFAQSMTNVIVRYTVKTGVYYYSCPNFVLDDWYGFYSPVEFVAEAGSYKRKDTAGMNSVCLPFDFDSDDVQGTIGSFVATDLISEDEEGNRVLAKTGNIYFNNVPSMMAGTPCIVECAEDVTEWDIDLAGRKIITTPNNAYAVKGQFYDSTIGEGYYKVSPDGKKFVNTDSESVSYTYRAYLDLANTGNMGAGANQFNIRWTDNPTAILNIINEKNSESYFDLTGRKVAEPVKGSICIVNGKKFIY